jgi:hypothetical protein
MEDATFELFAYVLAYFAAVVLGHFVVRGLMNQFPLPSDDERKEKELRHAGMTIGILERVFTLTFVLIDQYTAIALIFTAKSIARFEELKDRRFSEYYLIGTLSSILIAMMVGIVVLYALSFI